MKVTIRFVNGTPSQITVEGTSDIETTGVILALLSEFRGATRRIAGDSRLTAQSTTRASLPRSTAGVEGVVCEGHTIDPDAILASIDTDAAINGENSYARSP